MKKTVIPGIVCLIACLFTATAQIAISPDGSPPDNSAMLDIQSTNKGMLVPHMTKAQRIAISSPAAGLQVFQTDATQGFYYYSGIEWTMMDDPCGRTIVDYYAWHYHTVKIGNQCWLRENMNIGAMLNSGQNQNNDGYIQKYCYFENEANCLLYGGLYQWDEMMQYSTVEGTQGICPTGWHIPKDNEWKILEGYMDTEYGIGNSVWNNTLERGFNAGKNLKARENSWSTPLSNSDLMGFRAIPAGRHEKDNNFFSGLSYWAYFWSSTSDGPNRAWNHYLFDTGNGISRYNYQRVDACSVRCIRD